MPIHILSKRAGTINIVENTPDWARTLRINEARTFVASWQNEWLFIQHVITVNVQLYFIDTFCASSEELVIVIPHPFIAFHLSLTNSVVYCMEGIKEPVVFHERGFNILAMEKLAANVALNRGRSRSLILLLDKIKLQEYFEKFTRTQTLLTATTMHTPVRLARYNQVATPYMMQMVTALISAKGVQEIDVCIKKLLEAGLTILSKPVVRSQTQLTQVDINLLYKATDIIKTNLKSHFSIEQLASLSGLTESQVRNWFPKVFGITAIQYQLHYKMEQAMNLLKDPDRYTLDVIASKLGFFSASTFTRAFKAHFKMLPSEFVHGGLNFCTL